MASHGAALQTQNNELVKCIEELKEKREILIRSIREDEAEKSKIQQDLQVPPHYLTYCIQVRWTCQQQLQRHECMLGLQTLTKRLAQINDALGSKHGARTDYEKIIHETEQAYSKIVESSHTLLSVLKKEAGSIGKRAGHSQLPEGYHHQG